MNLTIDPSSPTPPFEQVRRGVIALVESGELIVGSRLPTVRALAAELGLAVNTVARAYRELESDGVIETRGRNGSIVLASGDSIHRSVEAAARRYAEVVAQLGFDREAAVAIVTAALTG
jgi:DNA-binding transcriptional regulator YhcF (GntR family)